MRISIWDILSILVIIITFCLCGVFVQIYNDPNTSFNIFRPPTPLPTIDVIIPTRTPTQRSMPATWTPTPAESPVSGPEEATLRPSQTIPPTYTVYTIPSFTPTYTPTNTATNTPTVTNTPTRTATPTHTLVPTFTEVPTWTLEPTWTLPPAP